MAGGGSRSAAPAAAAMGLAAFAAALVGILLTRASGGVASLWFANAVLLAGLLRAPRPWRPWLVAGFVIGNAAANVACGDTIPAGLAFGAINAGEAILAAALVRRLCRGVPHFRTVAQVLRFAAVAGVAAPALGASLGAGLVTAAFGTGYLQVWPTWFLADALGNLALAPPLLVLCRRARTSGRSQRPGLLAAAWPLGLVAATSLGVFLQASQPLAFLLVPSALVATWRLGPNGAALSALLITSVGGAATAAGLGPMALGVGGIGAQALVFQLLVLAVLGSTLLLAALLAERQDLEGRLRAAAEIDAMTGLANRATFMAAVEAAARLHVEETPLAVAILDVDHFKAVNDEWGHAVGDDALRLVARRLAGAVRGSDLCARLGGEEFGVLMPGATLADAEVACERLRFAVGQPGGVLDGRSVPTLTISAGVAALRPGEGADAVLSRADGALYAAKRAGRNQVALAA